MTERKEMPEEVYISAEETVLAQFTHCEWPAVFNHKRDGATKYIRADLKETLDDNMKQSWEHSWKWIERMLFCKKVTDEECKGILKHSPYAPWNMEGIDWDTSHLPYHDDIPTQSANTKIVELKTLIETIVDKPEGIYLGCDEHKEVMDLLQTLTAQKAEEWQPIDPKTDEPLIYGDPVHEFAADNDGEDYPFKGEEYDIELLEYFTKYLQHRGYLPQPPKQEGA